MKTLWYQNDIYIHPDILEDHQSLSFCKQELIDAIIHGDHRISIRTNKNGRKHKVVLTKSTDWYGREIELISKAADGWKISQKILIFHAFRPITDNFEREWRKAINDRSILWQL